MENQKENEIRGGMPKPFTTQYSKRELTVPFITKYSPRPFITKDTREEVKDDDMNKEIFLNATEEVRKIDNEETKECIQKENEVTQTLFNMNTYSQHYELTKEEKKLFITPPFIRLSEESVDSANQLYSPDNSFTPYFAESLERYKRAGGDIAKVVTVPLKENAKKQSSFNFELHLQKKVYKVYDVKNGEEVELLYGIRIVVIKETGRREEFEALVENSKAKEIGWLMKASHSLAYVPKGTAEKDYYEHMVQRCIETENVQKEYIYQRAGWRDIPEIGWKYVYGEGVVGTDFNAHTLTRKNKLLIERQGLGTKYVFDAMHETRNICPHKGTALELLVWTHAGILTTLFERAGHQIDFVMMIVGPTNSRKTSMTLAMTKLFDRENYKADMQFANATVAGMEKILGTYKDATLIIDDFKPGTTHAQQKELEQKLDAILRFFGDRVTKVRMLDFSANADKMHFPIGGNCVMTGEYVPNMVESSMTRMFFSEISVDDVDNEKLKFYQEHRWVVSTYFWDFITWVTQNFENIVDYIKNQFNEKRDKERFKVGRFGEMYATFMITGDLLVRYAVTRNFWTSLEGNEFLHELEKTIRLELSSMEDMLDTRDKATRVMKLLKECIQKGEVSAIQLTTETCGKRKDFYENENFYFATSGFLLDILSKFGRNIRVSNVNELLALLERKGVLEIEEKDGKRYRARKLPIQRGNTRRYLYLKKSILNKIED